MSVIIILHTYCYRTLYIIGKTLTSVSRLRNYNYENKICRNYTRFMCL